MFAPWGDRARSEAESACPLAWRVDGLCALCAAGFERGLVRLLLAGLVLRAALMGGDHVRKWTGQAGPPGAGVGQLVEAGFYLVAGLALRRS